MSRAKPDHDFITKDQENQLNTARQAGYDAHAAGSRCQDNPMPSGLLNYAWWQGWNIAEREAMYRDCGVRPPKKRKQL